MPQAFDRTSPKVLIPYFIALTLYVLMITYIGVRVDHYAFIGLFSLTYFASRYTHKFTACIIFFLIFWVCYDLMKIYPNYLVNDIHVMEPFDLEKSWFGINVSGKSLLLSEYLSSFHSPILDLLAGTFYLSWVTLPFAYGIYLFAKGLQRQLIIFSACFLLCNILGFIMYYIYPAAPPWYALEYGGIADTAIAGDPAGLLRFDQLIGYDIFSNMYNKNSNVFAAIPSLHAAYPMIFFYYARKNKHKLWAAVAFVDVMGIWLAAVYTLHHYVIDVLLGALCAILGIILFQKLLVNRNKTHILNRLSDYMID